MKLRFCPSIILLYTVASVEQHLRPHASGCTPAILKNEGMPEGSNQRVGSMMTVRDAEQIDVMRQIVGKRMIIRTGIYRLQDFLTPMKRLDPRFRQGGA